MGKEIRSEAELLRIINNLEGKLSDLETQNRDLVLANELVAKTLAQQNDALSKLNRFSL